MKCPRCQAENDAGARFCEDCGARLEAACPSCGTPVTPGKKFCRSCGAALTPEPSRFTSPESYTPKHLAERILTSKAALEGERKQVTVLFADLKGSMELLADRDPEEARKILDPVLERMMEAVHRYEGTVNQVMGDGIMALFGAPLAHEDHAVRACYAALRMQESVKQYAEEVRRSHAAVVKIRVGLNSGEVVVRAIGSDLHMDYTAVGQTTHLAARMEQIADPGAIVITPETLALCEGYVGVKSLGPVPVKGLAEAVEIYEVTGAGPARTRLQAAARRGLTRFVGRDGELGQLRRAQQLAGSGHGQVAAVVGEAGVGKSRLVYEFRTLVETKALAGERGRYRLTQPVQAIQVPATVQAMLAARIDRLPPEDKRLLQTASVVGKDVPWLLLQTIAELPEEALRRGLDHLQAAEFLHETGLYPDLEYAFTHALTHEVTYGGLLQERRRELHARIVAAIETLHRDRLGGEIERLAHHALRGELREKAVDYLRQAGLKAAARSALPDARAWFEQALGVLEALPERQFTLEQAFEIRLELRPVLVQLGEVRRMLERLREAETLAGKLNDERRRGRVCASVTNIHSLLGELDEALVSGTRALEIAGRLGDLRLRILTTTYLEQVHYFRGEYERVVELATDNLAALPADWVYGYFGIAAPPSVFDRVWLIMSLALLGRFAEAAEYEAEVIQLAEAIRLAEPTQHAHTVGMAHWVAATLRLLKGDWAKARSLIEHGIAVFRAGNVVLVLPAAVASSAWVLAQLGEASEALDRLREGEQLLERQAARGFVGNLGWDYHSLGRACLLLGRLDEARSLGDRAVESSPSHPGYAAHALHLLGDIATHPDRFEAESGETHYREALALAEPRGMRPLVAHCHLGLGKLSRRTGKREQAREHLTTATTMYREMDMRFWLEQAEAAMRELP